MNAEVNPSSESRIVVAPKRKLLTALLRGWRLRCPRCGQSKLFKNMWTMHDRCQHCGLLYEREPGFFLGSIYYNYGLTSLIATAAYPIATFGLSYPRTPTIACIVAFVVFFPLWFFRYARSLWLGFDQFVDPRTD